MRIGFVIEQILGHTTHTQNLKKYLESYPEITPYYADIAEDGGLGVLAKLPLLKQKWSLRASLGAYLKMRGMGGKLDAALFHTQMLTLFSAGIMEKIPSAISLDSPPYNKEEAYKPSKDSDQVKAAKKQKYLRIFPAAKHMIAWSQWVKKSLIEDYEVPAEKISVIPGGIDLQSWQVPDRFTARTGPFNVLFVGGDFARKGGDALIEAFRGLPPSVDARLHLVTNSPLAQGDNQTIFVHNNIKANTPEMRSLYAQADVFALPTRSDCMPFAIMEAMASGLPIITTPVGALREAVEDGRNGWIIKPDDIAALTERMRVLRDDPELRRSQGLAGRELAQERFDSSKNYGVLIQTLKNLK